MGKHGIVPFGLQTCCKQPLHDYCSHNKNITGIFPLWRNSSHNKVRNDYHAMVISVSAVWKYGGDLEIWIYNCLGTKIITVF